MGIKRITKEELVRKHLTRHKSITSWDAIQKYGCTRLSAVIYKLRKEGMNIKSDYVSKKNRYGYTVIFAKYILKK